MTGLSFISRLDDWINPIAIKEMRQAVKGRFITWALIVFLLIQLVIIGAVLVMRIDLNEDFNVGRYIFMAMLAVLLGTSLFFIPAFTAIRFSAERSDNNVDLFFITTLKPVRIIWGKLSAALILTLLFFSACMPFMTLTYLLRGLDLPSVFILLALDFLIVAVSIQFGILLACFPGGVIARSVRFLAGLFFLFAIFSYALTMSFALLYQGVGSTIGASEFWATALSVVAFFIMGIGLLFVLSVTIITPASANKALGIRIYLLFLWIATAVITILWFLKTKDDGGMYSWALIMMCLFGTNLFITICERQKWGPRVARRIPKSRILRIPAFLLYSGAAGGIAFSVLMMLATIWVLIFFLNDFGFAIWNFSLASPSTYFSLQFAREILCLPLYAFCYSLTALFIKNLFFRRSAKTATPAVVALMLLAAGCIIPVIIGFLARSTPWFEISAKWFMGNPMVLFWEEDIWIHCFLLTGIWSICIFAMMLPWFVKQFISFKTALKTQNLEANK